MLHYVYIITNNVNGKTYIGQHTQQSNIIDDYLGSGKLIKLSIEKYGKDKFTKEILEIVDTRDELSEVEEKYIRYYKSINKAEYNILLVATPDVNFIYKDSETFQNKRRESLKVAAKKRAAVDKKAYEERIKKAKEEYASLIIELYSELNSIRKVNKELKCQGIILSSNIVRTILLELNIDISKPHNLGKPHSYETKMRISNANKSELKVYICKECYLTFNPKKREQVFCSKDCALKNKRTSKLSNEELLIAKDFKENGKSYREIAEYFNNKISRQRLHVELKRFNDK